MTTSFFIYNLLSSIRGPSRPLLISLAVALTQHVIGAEGSAVRAAEACAPVPSQVKVEACPNGGAGKIVSMIRDACPDAPAPWRPVIDSCGGGAKSASDQLCANCIDVRVGPPRILRGPFHDELDTYFSVIRLPDGGFRGFTSNADTYAVDGRSPSAMSGRRQRVAPRGTMGPGSECGNWLQSEIRRPDALYGFFHVESACDRKIKQTNKAMVVAASKDNGSSWEPLGPIISSSEAPRRGGVTGIGDCTIVDGHDGFAYAYCLRARDWKTVVSRAPLDHLGSGSWRQWDGHDWSQPGLEGEGAPLGVSGASAGWWEAAHAVILLGEDQWFGGLRMWISQDKKRFTPLADPILNFEANNWARPAATSVQAYPAIIDPENGGNQFENRFLLTYTFVPEGKTFRDRYLIQQDVTLTRRLEPVSVQTKRAIALWRDKTTGRAAASSYPMIGDYQFERVLGYELTRPLPDNQSVEIGACQDDDAASTFIAPVEDCTTLGATRLRAEGWLQRKAAPGLRPLYLCRSDHGRFYNALDQACGRIGKLTSTIGYLWP